MTICLEVDVTKWFLPHNRGGGVTLFKSWDSRLNLEPRVGKHAFVAMFSKVFCFRGVRKHLYMRKGSPFPTCKRILMQLKQITFEDIVAKGEIANKLEISPFVPVFSTLFSNYGFIHIDNPCSCLDMFKVVSVHLMNLLFPS